MCAALHNVTNNFGLMFKLLVTEDGRTLDKGFATPFLNNRLIFIIDPFKHVPELLSYT